MSKKRGHNEGGITKRKDGRWQGTVTIGRNDDGSQKRQYVYGKTRGEVAEQINKILNEINTGTYIDKSKNPTVEDWLNYWLITYKKNSVKPKTYDQYEGMIRVHLIPNFGNYRLVDLSESQLQKFYNNLFTEGLSARSIYIINTVLSSALKRAVKSKLVPFNVCEAVELPKQAKKERRVLTMEAQKKLLKVLKEDELGAMYIFALFTGLRRGEVLVLRWSDVDLNEGTIKVTKTLSRVSSRYQAFKSTYYG